MGADELRAAQSGDSPDPEPGAEAARPRVLCYVNHYYGESPGFVGKSATQDPFVRRQIVERSLAALRTVFPQADVRVCGVPGKALLPIDLPFALEDPRQLVYASLNHMADQLSRYDWFVNIEDDIELPAAAFENALAFERESLANECLLPNRLERRGEDLVCVDMSALPGWTTQERSFRGHSFRVAVNPHSAVLMLSREKFAYALARVDRGYRGVVVGGLMASAYAHFHRPLSLYRAFDEPAFHSVIHLDEWMGQVPRGGRLEFSAILLSWRRRHNLPAIVRALKAIPQVREILVWNNDPSQPLELPGASVVQAPRNFRCLARYGLVPLARYDNIFFQDDDLLVHPHQFAALLSEYAADPSRIYGLRGRNLRDGKYVFADAYGDVDIVLGQTMMFHRKLLREAFASLGDLPPQQECDDIAFSLSCRRKHRAVRAEPIEDLGMSDAAALHLAPGQPGRRQEAVDKLLAWTGAHPGEETLRAQASAAQAQAEEARVRAGAEQARADEEAARAATASARAEAERARAEEARAQAARLRAELLALQASHRELAGSLTVRAAEEVKRLPLLYPGYLKLKALIPR